MRRNGIIMDQDTRSELDKLHERITRLRERVVNLEAQQPHINAALVRIEGLVEKLANKIGRAVWAVATPLIVLIVGVLFKLVAMGAAF